MIARLRRCLADESGIALVMAVGILAFMSLTITGTIYFTSTNQRSSSYAKAEVAAIDFAEAGINNAFAVLFDIQNARNMANSTLLTPRTSSYPGGSVTWKGELVDVTGQPLYWLVTATGRVKNPTGPAGDVRRTLTMKVPMQAPSLTTPAMDIWNWIYTHRTGFVCDMTILQSVNLTSPLYVRGNLCLRNGARIARGPLIVGGALDQQNPQTSVGTLLSPLNKTVKIGAGCRWSNSGDITSWVVPCKVEPWLPSTKVFVDPSKLVAGNQIPADPLAYPISLPNVWWAEGHVPAGQPVGTKGWYEYAAPGPYYDCETQTGTPPVFDTKTATGAPDGFNNSVPGVFNLTPSTGSYSCMTRGGYLTWNHLTRTLTIAGTVFIDGSAKVDNNGSAIKYTGQGVIYLGGTLLIKNTNLCAVRSSNGNDCDFTAWNPSTGTGWDPNSTLIGFFAHGSGGQISDPTVGIQVVSSHFQGALYAEWAIDASTTTKTQGPMIAKTEVRVGQTNENEFPHIDIAPIGMGDSGPSFYQALDPNLG
jgi:hypothetical protein